MKHAAWLLSLLIVGGAPAWAQMNSDDAAVVASAGTASRVLAIEQREIQGHVIWRVKVLSPSGEVSVVLVDSASGRIL